MVIVGKSISGSFDDLAICAGAALPLKPDREEKMWTATDVKRI